MLVRVILTLAFAVILFVPAPGAAAQGPFGQVAGGAANAAQCGVGVGASVCATDPTGATFCGSTATVSCGALIACTSNAECAADESCVTDNCCDPPKAAGVCVPRCTNTACAEAGPFSCDNFPSCAVAPAAAPASSAAGLAVAVLLLALAGGVALARSRAR